MADTGVNLFPTIVSTLITNNFTDVQGGAGSVLATFQTFPTTAGKYVQDTSAGGQNKILLQFEPNVAPNTFASSAYPDGSVITGINTVCQVSKIAADVNNPGFGFGVVTPSSINAPLTNFFTPILTGAGNAYLSNMFSGVGYGYADIATKIFTLFTDFDSACKKQIHTFYIQVFYNKPMLPTIAVNSSATLTPTLTWTSPDQDAVADPLLATNITVFRTADTLATGFDPFTDAGVAASVWHTTIYGDPVSKTVVIAGGALQTGVSYKAYIRCADIFFNGAYRYSTSAYALSTANVTWTTGGTPSPGASITINNIGGDTDYYNPNSLGGVIGPITVRTRPNLHYMNNASFEDKAAAAVVGSWALSTDGTGGTLTSVSTGGAWEPSGTYHARIAAATGGAPTRSGISASFERTADSKLYKQRPGQILMVQTRSRPATTKRTVNMQFGWQTSANALIGTDRKNNHIQYGTTKWSTHTQFLPVPATADNFYQRIHALTATSENHDFDGVNVTPYGFNLLTNAGLNIARGAPAVPDFWSFSTSGTGVAVLQDCPVDSPAGGFTSGDRCVSLSATTASDANLTTVDSFAIDGLKYIFSAKVRYVNDYAGATATNSVLFRFLMDDSSVIDTTISGLTPNVWQRVGAVVDGTAISASRSGQFVVKNPTNINHLLVADVMVEPIWTFANGNMETGTATTALEPSCCLGETTTTVVSGQTPTPQQWINESTTLTDVTWSIVSAHGGVQSALMSPGSGRVAAFSQYFTVAGMTSVAIDHWLNVTTLPAGTSVVALLNFYDSAGVALSNPAQAAASLGTTGISSANSYTTLTSRTTTTAGFQHFTPAAVTIPTNASYAKLTFQADGTNGAVVAYTDDVTVALTGSYGASSTYLEGGFQTGSPYANYDAVTQTVPFTIQLGLQRSSDLVNWYDVRGHSGELGLQAIQSTVDQAPFSHVYLDNEFPLPYPDPAGVPYVFYYRGIVRTYDQTGLNTVSTGPASTPISVTADFRINDWWLIDRANLGTIAGLNGTTTWGVQSASLILQVKKAHIDKAESAAEFIAMGRDRKVVIGDTVLGDTVTLDLQTLSHTDHEALRLLIESQKTMLLRSPDGEYWWVRVTKRARDRTWTGTYVTVPLRTYQVVFEEVDSV